MHQFKSLPIKRYRPEIRLKEIELDIVKEVNQLDFQTKTQHSYSLLGQFCI